MKVKIMLGELIKARGISLNELSHKTGVRRAALSELANEKRENINFKHIEEIADALGITDIREIITLIDEE
ncbi:MULTISPECIES: helix-turn-helix transcriptional regulator [unclassified Paenibacillus]|jgi:DNA-binding Xre family transcriptional regulator|uniref:helix-turn-helix domain-containing protein n=1 Tax=unclassified Paenibacillus TaxID=185978 RepID=UPI0017884D2E|nr:MULTISPECIES: helix-turn-helix transcriptional regulator [unclassified Paenibacillus]MBE0339464.1 XRE family transcriptional regulator [Paenibacillus sp. 23TSA30-6]